MKATTKLLSCGAGFLIALHSVAFSEITQVPGKVPVIVLQGEVTIDGLQRPDLGRSFADTLTGGFLKAKAYDVIDHLSNQPIAQAVENKPQLAPELSAVSVGESIGARWIYVPRMVVEGDFHKLTMKKIRVSDGKVVDVFETHASGDRSTMFLLIGDALKDIYAKAPEEMSQRDPAPIDEAIPLADPEGLDPTPTPLPPGSYTPEPAPEEVLESTSAATPPETPDEESAGEATATIATETKPVPAGLKLVNGTYVQDKDALASARPDPATTKAEAEKIKDPATETEEKFARYMGTIASVNSEWRFCVLKVRGNQSLRVGDHLSVKTGAIVPDEVTLIVTKTEGSQAVADLDRGATLADIKAGQKIYQWTLK